MTQGKIIVGVVTLLLVGLGALGLGWQQGRTQGLAQGQASAVAQVKQADTVDAQVMAYVLKKNPDATIRDFSDFPRILFGESEAAGIDPRIILALIDKESQFNPKAVGKAGEIGLMQVMPATGALVAKSLGMPFEYPKGTNLGTLGLPRHNLRIGIRFLKDRIDEFGDMPTALRGYNRGSLAARQYRPWDRYAEDIALRHLVLAQAMPR